MWFLVEEVEPSWILRVINDTDQANVWGAEVRGLYFRTVYSLDEFCSTDLESAQSCCKS